MNTTVPQNNAVRMGTAPERMETVGTSTSKQRKDKSEKMYNLSCWKATNQNSQRVDSYSHEITHNPSKRDNIPK